MSMVYLLQTNKYKLLIDEVINDLLDALSLVHDIKWKQYVGARIQKKD